jgi:hypothetical protein
MGSIESRRATHHEGFPRTFPMIFIPAPGQHGVADALINIAPDRWLAENDNLRRLMRGPALTICSKGDIDDADLNICN